MSDTDDGTSSADAPAAAAPPRKLSDSLFGTWKLVEKHGGPPSIHDEIKGTLVLEEGGAGLVTMISGDLFPMTFTVDDSRHPTKITCRISDANEAFFLVDSFAPPRLVLKQRFEKMMFPASGGDPEKSEIFETQVYEKQREFAPPRVPKAVAALRQLGAAVLLDDKGDVEFVDLYPFAAISATKPPTAEITDDDLKHLSGLTALRTLQAPSCRITNAGLSHLTSLKALRTLKLQGNAISDDGLRAIAPLSNLQELAIHFTNISDAGLIHIQKLQQLRDLSLGSTKITDAGLVHIQKLERLCHLSLGSTKITDRGLQSVSILRDMKDLDLCDTQVTDQGLKYLGELTKLKTLYLYNTKVTDGGVKELKARIPSCEINH